MQLSLNSNNKEPQFWALCVLLLGIILCVYFRSCKQTPNEPIKITPIIKYRDSLIREVKYRDVVRTEYIKLWRDKKVTIHDTLYHEIISICDTIIKHDSIVIDVLKEVVRVDSVILNKTVQNKNDTIKLLKKEIKRQKWHKRGILALWVIREGTGIAAKIR